MKFTVPLCVVDQEDDFNWGDLELFSTFPLRNMVREVIQNSKDQPQSNDRPVIVSFTHCALPREEFPGWQRFYDAVSQSFEVVDQGPGKEFFKQAKNKLLKKEIHFLRCADFNTTGLEGPCERKKPLHTFMKSRGKSDKISPNASGSRGLGRNACFTVSDFRAFFVSTAYTDAQGQMEEHAMGMARLISHRNLKALEMKKPEEECWTQGVGYWGTEDDCKSISENIPEFLLRKNHIADGPGLSEQGLSILIAGFDPEEGWEGRIALYAVENYFQAIRGGILEVLVGENLRIHKGNLTEILNDNLLEEASASELEGRQRLNETKQFDRCLTLGTEEKFEVEGLGECSLHILMGEEYDKKVGFIRNDMFITTEIVGCKKFDSRYKSFVAVLQCLNEDGEIFLRSTESALHDEFSPGLIQDKDKQNKANQVLMRLGKEARKVITKHAREESASSTPAELLAEYLPANSGDLGSGPDATEGSKYKKEMNFNAPVVLVKKKITRPKYARRLEEDTFGEEGGAVLEGEGRRSRNDGGTGLGTRGRGATTKRKKVTLKDQRVIPLPSRERDFYFTPNYSGNVKLSFYDYGAKPELRAKISVGEVVSGSGTVEDGDIIGLPVEEGNRTKIRFKLVADFEGSIGVQADEI